MLARFIAKIIVFGTNFRRLPGSLRWPFFGLDRRLVSPGRNPLPVSFTMKGR
jgi:hypothetical protein